MSIIFEAREVFFDLSEESLKSIVEKEVTTLKIF